MIRLLLLLFISINICAENRDKIVIIDTGISFEQSQQSYICKDGLRFMRSITTHPFDENGHGTNILSIIAPKIKKSQCVVSYKIFNAFANTDTSQYRYIYEDILKLPKVKFLNMSVGGEFHSDEELSYLKRILSKGSIIAVAAGNNNLNLTRDDCPIYPACYKVQLTGERYQVVANIGNRTNYGSQIITHTEDGNNKGQPVKSGSSQSTAIVTSKNL